MDIRKQMGREGEIAAAAFLEKQGVRILIHNFHCRWGEIDLIGKENNMWIVVEVKRRMRKAQGYPCEAVDLRKQKKICRTYDFFRMQYQIDDFTPVRFDVVEVNGDCQCRWIQNAFSYQID